VDKKKISLNEHIKVLGEYEAKVKLYAGVSANLKVIIARKDK
jgi:ribosomal protein L9